MRPFSRFEWMLAGRYLRARSKKGSLSIIALFSFIGIALGVTALIIVMSVMNGFHQELFDKILGLNGHIVVEGKERNFTGFDEAAERIRAVPGVRKVIPVVEGQVLMTTANTSGVVNSRRSSRLPLSLAACRRMKFSLAWRAKPSASNPAGTAGCGGAAPAPGGIIGRGAAWPPAPAVPAYCRPAPC